MISTKEAYHKLESVRFFNMGELFGSDSPEQIETRRRIIDFVHELETARFMLAMSFKQPGSDPYLDLFEEKDFNNKFKHDYYRQHYLYSAAIWYHNSFDMILQCLWFHFKLHGSDTLTSVFVKDTITKCKDKKVVGKLYLNDQQNPISLFKARHHYILEIANGLKHRQYISNDSYLLYGEAYALNSQGYCSNETIRHVNLEELQDKLLLFHSDIVALSKELLTPICNCIVNDLDNDSEDM